MRYADCLVWLGDYDTAELLLEQATIGGDMDNIQIAALLLWSNLIKDRGRHGELSLRIEKLREALQVAMEIEKRPDSQDWIRSQIATLKH